MQTRPLPRNQRRRAAPRRAARGLVLGATVIASGTIAVPAHAQEAAPSPSGADAPGTTGAPQASARLRFDIPAGPLSDALDAFTRVTGLKITLEDPALGAIQSPGVSGTLTPRDALDAILAGTSVRGVLDGATVRVGVRGLDEFVEVAGSAPRPASPKFTQPLRDTPQTIVIIPQEVLAEQNVTTLRDAVRNTPGVTLTAGEGGTAPGDNFLIRGFSARNDVFIDGARDPGVLSRDTFNTETIEIAKGPASVTTGRGSTGGSINLVTKGATLQNRGELRLSGGNADQKRSTFDINHRVGNGIGIRLNAMWQDSGVPGRDAATQKGWGVAPSIGFGLDGNTSATVSYQHLNQDNVPDYGLPGTLPDLANAAGVTVKDLDFSNFYGLLSRDYEKINSDVVTGTVEHRFDDNLRLRNLTRFGRNDVNRVVTPPRAASPANGGADPGFDATVAQIRRTDTKYQFRDDKSVTNQTDLNASVATGPIQHAAVVGLEFAHDNQPSYSATDTYANGRPPVTDLFNPDPTQGYSAAIQPTGATSEATANSVALYGFDTMKLGPKVQVDLGLRWDYVDVAYDTVSATGVAADFGRIDHAFSGRSGLVYKPVTRVSLYGAYSSSFNPSYDGAFGLTLAGTGANNEALPPERSHNIEVGTKWDATSRLFATLAVFRTEKTNAKTTDATTGATVLAGNQLVQGVELGLSGNLTRRWAIFTGIAFMDATIEESLVAAEVDRQLSYAPKQSFSLWSTYELPFALTLGGGANFTGGYYFSNTNALTNANQAAIQSLTKYWLVNAMASQRLTRNIAIQLNITNLANERYVDRGYSGHFIPGAGRSIVISPIITF